MDQSSQNLLSDREKGERLKEIFETLNKMKKRLERLKAARSLSPAEMKEYTEVSAKLSSFHEKCKNFIKTRKNGPGKFMIEEYLKWCSSQKSAQHRGGNQYKSSLEYVKSTYGQERSMHAADSDAAKAYGQPFSPGQPLDSTHSRGMYFREAHSPHQLSMAQRPFEQVPLHGYPAGAKLPDRMLGGAARPRVEGSFCSSFSNGVRSGAESPGLLRANLGCIEPLQCQKETLGSPRGVYHYTSSSSGYITRPQGAALQPVTVAARRSAHLESKGQNPEGPGGERRASQSCNVQGAYHGKPHPFDSVHNAHCFGTNTVSAMLGGLSQRDMASNPKYGSAGGSFSKSVMSPTVDPYILSPDSGYVQNGHGMGSGFSRASCFVTQAPHSGHAHSYRPQHAGSSHFVPQSPLQFCHSVAQPLQYDQSYKALSRNADSRFEVPAAKVRKTLSPRSLSEVSVRGSFAPKFQAVASSPRNVHSVEASFASTARAGGPPHEFPFEFRFDNRVHSSARAPISSPNGNAPGILRDEGGMAASARPPGIVKETEKKSTRLSLSHKLVPKHDLSGIRRTLLDDLIRETDPELCLSPETKDYILIHLDSVLHKAIMISATIASTRLDRTVSISDICLGFCKTVKPAFDCCFEGQKQIEDCRDYTLHNRILEIIESQEQ